DVADELRCPDTIEANCAASIEWTSSKAHPQRTGTANAIRRCMMISKKRVNRALQGMIVAMPAIGQLIRRRRRNAMLSYVFGGLGVAIAGGIVAVMMLSPRTRRRALHAAKDTYGRLNERMSHLRPSHGRFSEEPSGPLSNGLAAGGTDYSGTPGM